LRAAGFDNPRIAVAGLNPHAGDGGNFGREEIDVIEPAVARPRPRASHVEGPYPSDTVSCARRNGDFDAVLTMYHDQGQIAMKLMGFDRGVTLIGGFPFPICTPAHGTAYEIAGKGVANLGATRAAMLLRSAWRPRPPSGRAEIPLRNGGGVSLISVNQQKSKNHTEGSMLKVSFALAISAIASCAGNAQAAWAPSKPVEFVVTPVPVAAPTISRA
jgi:hypothetical protein